MTFKFNWQNLMRMSEISYDCGHCGSYVAPSNGYQGIDQNSGSSGFVMICPKCSLPTSIARGMGQVPSPQFGEAITGISNDEVKVLYDEARRSFSARAYTGAVMLARKILMNLAVQHGAEENLKFIEYVDYLSENGWVPPNGKKWVDQIRQKGNDANHELHVMNKEDAEQVLKFLSMLLKFMYELATP